MVDEGEYVINPSFDDELKEISDKKKKVVKKIKGREDEVKIQIGSPSSFKIDNDKTHGWFYRISRKVIYRSTRISQLFFCHPNPNLEKNFVELLLWYGTQL
jgi:DNA mismatch repair ATPase MutS